MAGDSSTHVAVSLDQKKAHQYHAYFACSLERLTPISHQERISGQTLLATHLEQMRNFLPGVSRTFELRYIVWPEQAEPNKPERVQCFLIARLSDWRCSAEQLRAKAETLAEEVQHVIADLLPTYGFVPLTSKQSLRHILMPFPVVDTGEVHHRVAANTASVSLPLPLLGIVDVDQVIEMMLLQPAPTLLSFCLEPASPMSDLTSLVDRVEHVARSQETASVLQRPMPSGEPSGVEALLRTHHGITNHYWQMTHLAALQQRAFSLRIQLAGAAPLSDALIAMLTSEVGGPGHLTAESAWQDPTLPIAGGAAWVMPRSRRVSDTEQTEFCQAVENLETLGFLPWSASAALVSHNFQSLANLSEVGRLFALPAKAPWLATQGTLLSLPYRGNEKTTGIVLGVNPVRGTTQQVVLPEASRTQHLWVIGQTGTGKSTLLESLILQDIAQGHAVIVIDPHGDLIQDVLGRIPRRRKKDVILFDPADTQHPVGLNPLEASNEDEQALVVSSFIGLLKKLYDPYNQGITGPRFQHAARNGLLTVMSKPGGTLIEFVRAFTDEAFLKTLLPLVKDPLVRRYWTDQIAHTQDFHRSEILDWVVSKFSAFVTDPLIRRIIGQSESSFSFRTAMDKKKIVLLSLAKGLVGSENANFLGLILLPKILQAALSRANIALEERQQVRVYIDEFQNYATDSLALMLAEARKYRLSLTLANQHVGQITPEIRDAVIGNVGSVLAFRVGIADAAAIEQMLAVSPVTSHALTSLPNYSAYGRLMIEGRRSPAFTLETLPIAQQWNAAVADEVRALSQKVYGRERAKVDASIQERASL